MSKRMIPAGPYKLLTAQDGTAFPYYIVPFDKNGSCIAPATRAHLLAAAAAGKHSDVFFFSHGWNNDWEAATQRYREFIAGYQAQRATLGLPLPADYKPLLVGIFWPSQTMAWSEDERGPQMASHDPVTQVAEANAMGALIGDIAADLPLPQRGRFYALAQSDALNSAEARELAELLTSVAKPDMEHGTSTRDADDLLLAASADSTIASGEPDYDDTGATVAAGDDRLTAAGWLEKLDPRNLIKPFTVWQMKDRAGTVGRGGVSALLGDLLCESNARIHLFGHSYGCKVVMEALAALPPDRVPRPVHSATLFQAAFSHAAFAPDLPESPGTRGGFESVLARVKGPVVATFSENDRALRRHFHLALRRQEDYGELQAASSGSPPKYGALGGFGPYPVGERLSLLMPGSAYAFGTGGRVLGIDSTGLITGHGDISNVHTWWLAYSNVSADH